MAAKKKVQSSDGLKLIGRKDGKLKYEATLRRKHKGRLVVDTTAIILADSKAEALIEKARRLDEAVKEKLGLTNEARKTFGEAVGEFLGTLRGGTRLPYGSHLKKFVATIGADRWLDEIAAQELQRVIATSKVSDKTTIQVRIAARSLFAWAKECGYIRVNVALETVRRRTRKTSAELLAAAEETPTPKAMSADELNCFLSALRDINPDVHAMAGTQFLLGCRFGEVSALRWRDVDLRTGVVHIRQAQYNGELGPPKNGKPREAALGPVWLDVLRAHRQRMLELGRLGCGEWCFPAPDLEQRRTRKDSPLYTYSTVRDTYRRAMAAAGVSVGAVTHSLRHTMISLAQLEGANLAARHLTGQKPPPTLLQGFVGHATPEMTEHYTHVPSAEIVDFAARLEQKLRSEGPGGAKGGGNRTGQPAKRRKQ